MDFGDDPLISTKYAQIHARAAQALKPGSKFALHQFSNRQYWAKMSLDALKNMLVTPEMCVAAGMKWKVMCSKHGADQLFNFGYRWPTMLASGFAGSHLRCLSSSQLARLGINATRMLECRPDISDISALHMSPQELHDVGWTLEGLQSIGLNMTNMLDFGYTLQQWKTTFTIDNFQTLGFTSKHACTSAGWRQQDIDIAFALKEKLPHPRATSLDVMKIQL